MNYVEVDDLSNHELECILYDWVCGMYYAFNGRPYPTDYPRSSGKGPLRSGGQHLAYQDFVNYCEERGVYAKTEW